MQIDINEVRELSNKVLGKLGFPKDLAELTTTNLLEAEMVQKKTHGFIRIASIKEQVETNKLNLNTKDLEAELGGNLLTVKAKNLPAYYPYYKSLEKSTELARNMPIMITTLQDIGYASGYIGSYARQATESDLIFIAFNNSPGGLIPHGAKKEIWGTDPVTVGIPTNDLPVILDMASSKISWGDLLVAKNEGKEIPDNVALDKEGSVTTDPSEAMRGGLLPIAGHKGSGLAFIVEILAGALSASRIGYSVGNSWGSSMYILINPSFFRPLEEFKKDVETAINELKNTPKQSGVKEIYFPGERSQKMFREAKKSGVIDVKENIIENMRNLLAE